MQKLNVSFLSGLIVAKDAMSNICRQHMETIHAWGVQNRLNVEVRVYAAAREIHDARIVQADTLGMVVADPHFQSSQLVIGEFGCIFGLFDAIHFAHPMAKTVIVYHGITPPAVVPEEMANALRASYRQIGTALGVDLVVTQSQFLKTELVNMGVESDRVAVVPLSVAVKPPKLPATRKHDPDHLKLVYLGRFVRSKGIPDLIEAVRLLKLKSRRVQVVLMGSKRLSDPECLEEIEEQIADAGLGEAVELALDLSNDEVARELGDADALVMPSYHEGFCVPIIEALNCGCFVICSDRGSLPEVSAGLARSFAAKDSAQLSSRIEELGESLARGGFTTDRGFIQLEEWKRQVTEHLKTFEPARCDRMFIDRVMEGVGVELSEADQYLADIRRDAVIQLHQSSISLVKSDWVDAQVRQLLKDAGEWERPKFGPPSDSQDEDTPEEPAKDVSPDAAQDALKSTTDDATKDAPKVSPPGSSKPRKNAESRKSAKASPRPSRKTSSRVHYAFETALLMREPAEDFILGIYDLLLGRRPEPNALAQWIEQIQAGTPRIRIVDKIACSGEAISRGLNLDWLPDLDHFRYPPDYTHEILRIMTVPEEEFIRDVFRILLDREPDAQSTAFFLTQLRGGTHRIDIVRFIGYSDECRKRLIDVTWLEKMPDVEDLIVMARLRGKWHDFKRRLGFKVPGAEVRPVWKTKNDVP